MRGPTPQNSPLFHKFLIMADEVYYEINDLLNRPRKADTRLKQDFLPHRINKETLLVDRQYSVFEVPILEVAKK